MPFMYERNHPDESTRLLEASSAPASPSSRPPSRPQLLRHHGESGSSARRTILTVAAVFLILNMGSFVSFAAETAILQQVICDKYFHQTHYDVPIEGKCKSQVIQSEVAYVNGWRSVFEILPAISLAVPYGILADRIGRKRVLLLAIVGCFMNDVWVRIVYWFHDFFPVRAVWFGGLWQLIGAGAATLQSVIHVMVADACPADQRTIAFTQIQSAQLLAEFLLVPIGGALVSVNPWIPMLTSSLFMVIGFLGAVFFVPETGGFSKINEDPPEISPPAQSDNGNESGTYSRMRESITGLVTVGRWAGENGRAVLVLTCFFLYNLGHQGSGSLLLQYASKRLGWSLGQASYLHSLGAGVNLVVHALAIPALSSFLLWRLHLHEIAKDKRIAQISGIFLVIGSIFIFLATSWAALVAGEIVTSMGFAFVVPARSVITSMVVQEHRAALYTVIAVLAFAGMLAGGPAFAGTFQWGMGMGDFWMGTPFLLAAICFLLALFAVSAASDKVQGRRDSDDDVREG